MKLKSLLTVPGNMFSFRGERGRIEGTFSGVSIDSRSITPGQLFVAIRGERHDGHDYVLQALERGAAGAVVEQSWCENHPESTGAGVLFAVADTLRALQELAHFYRRKFTLPVVALTGTNGKTTTKEMLAAVLSQKGDVCKTEGNLNNHIGLPLTLFNLEARHAFAVLEMGTNHFGEIARLCEIAEPEFGLITNIGYGHTEFLKDLQGVTKAKTELFDFLQPGGVAFINLDDPNLARQRHVFAKKITYSLQTEADVTARILPPDSDARPGLEIHGLEIRPNVAGRHNLSNALAAIAVGTEFGVPLPEMKSALENLTLPGKRMELLRLDRLTLLNDCYNANPDSTAAALVTLREMPTNGRRIFVFGDMLELGENAAEAHRSVGLKAAELGIDMLFAFGPQAQNAISGAKEGASVERAEHFASKTELFRALIKNIGEDDLVLIKGSRGMQMEEIVTWMLEHFTGL